MDYAIDRPWWPMMNGGDDIGRRRPGRGPRPESQGERGEGRGRRGERRDGVEGEHGPRGHRPDGVEGEHGPLGHRPDGLHAYGPRHRGSHGRGPRARRGDVRLAILALLAERPLNGYQMIQQLDEKTSGAWKPSPGAIYPAIAQLEDERLIEPFDNEGARAFRLTGDGSTAAARIDPKPWETVNEEFGPRSPREAARLWEAYGALAMAARAVMGTGTPAQIDEAVEILGEARRRLFGLLSRD